MRTDGKTEVQHYVPQVLLRLHIIEAGTPSAGLRSTIHEDSSACLGYPTEFVNLPSASLWLLPLVKALSFHFET